MRTTHEAMPNPRLDELSVATAGICTKKRRKMKKKKKNRQKSQILQTAGAIRVQNSVSTVSHIQGKFPNITVTQTPMVPAQRKEKCKIIKISASIFCLMCGF